MRNSQSQVEFTSETNDERTQNVIVKKIVEIVKDFITKHSITEIETEEDGQRLIVKSKSYEEDKADADVQDKADEEGEDEKVILENVEVMKDLEEDSEYLEVYLDGSIEDEETQDEIEEMIVEGLETSDNMTMEYESDSSINQQQSASECASESRTHSNPRRPRNPEKWKSTKRKVLRNSGQTYMNTKGKLVEARKMKESCGTACRSKCITRITEDDRQHNFDDFWSLGDVVKQRKFIYMHITSAEPKRRRSENSIRSMTHNFFLDAKDDSGSYKQVQCCKKMFRNTLVISTQVIQGVVRKYAIEGFVDTRGKFQRKLTEGQKFAVEHVKKFPFFYIEQSMTKVQCYQMYIDECQEKGVEPVKEGNYRVIFDKQNQGSFLKTEKVNCEACHRFYRSSDEQREKLQAEHEIHISLGASRKCRDRALSRIRHLRAQNRKKAQKMSSKSSEEPKY